MARNQMSISAFARRSLLSPKALRLYDESGLLRPERVDPHTGYRYYSESQLEKARTISLLRRLDVPLATIARIVNSSDLEDAVYLLDEWWRFSEDEFERKRDLQRFVRGQMVESDSGDLSSNHQYQILIREVRETAYVFRSSHVTGPDLPSFIAESHELLQERASQLGGAVGSATVIYRGVVDMDSDGPVDVCFPIASSDGTAEDVRTEARHLQAYIRVLKRQVEFPQILHVYKAIRDWIETEDHEISGPPREVYLGAFDSAAASDPICDIAFPIRIHNGELDV